MTPSQFRVARAFLGLSRPQLAKKLHVSPETVSNIENSVHKPSETTMEAADRVFKRWGIAFFELPDGTAGVMHNPKLTRDALLLAAHEEKAAKNDTTTIQD